ncbi:adenylate kinase [Aerococcaceae bacterium NML191219]|nr:adenylate kinase [Aerococcaceae bacterium NML191219]
MKIMVIGCPGSGKSTFSKVLHDITGIPLYHLDMLNWNADRTTVDKAVFLKRLLNTINKSEWIIDGNYGSTIELRLKACDTVVFMDYPLDICLTGIKERKGKPRTDLPWVEIDEDDTELIEFIKNYNIRSKPHVLALLNQYPEKDIHIFTDRSQATNYLQSLKYDREE